MLLLNNQMKNMGQSSKSSVTLGAVWRTLTLAGEELRSRRSLHLLNLGPNHLHLSKVLFIICVFFNLNVEFWSENAGSDEGTLFKTEFGSSLVEILQQKKYTLFYDSNNRIGPCIAKVYNRDTLSHFFIYF